MCKWMETLRPIALETIGMRRKFTVHLDVLAILVRLRVLLPPPALPADQGKLVIIRARALRDGSHTPTHAARIRVTRIVRTGVWARVT